MLESWLIERTPKIIYGAKRFSELANFVPGRRVALITTKGSTQRGTTAAIKSLFGDRLVGVMDRIDSYPNLDHICDEAQALRILHVDSLLAVGGGSAIDSMKAIAVGLSAPDGYSLAGHFRERKALHHSNKVCLSAVPTTAGTGAEATPFGTLWDVENRKKYSVNDPSLLPSTVLLDPELTVDLPEDVTVATGLDAISQGFESLWNLHSNAISEGWALQCLRFALPTLPQLLSHPENVEMRGRMMLASLLSGMAISVTRTALAHSMSYPLTSHFAVPHGLACSFTLPAILEFSAETDDGRLARVANALGFDTITELHKHLAQMLDNLGMSRRLRQYAPDLRIFYSVVEEMYLPERADNLVRKAGITEIKEILRRSLP